MHIPLQERECLAGRSLGSRRTWPRDRSRLSSTIFLIGFCFVLLYISSFRILSDHRMFNIFRMHLMWNTSSFLLLFSVAFHVSLAYNAVGTTILPYSLSFSSRLIVLDAQTMLSFWNTPCALPSRALISLSAFPLLARLLPR